MFGIMNDFNDKYAGFYQSATMAYLKGAPYSWDDLTVETHEYDWIKDEKIVINKNTYYPHYLPKDVFIFFIFTFQS